MNEKEFLNRTIASLIVVIVAYYVLGFVIPFLIWGVIGLVAWRIYQEHSRRR